MCYYPEFIANKLVRDDIDIQLLSRSNTALVDLIQHSLSLTRHSLSPSNRRANLSAFLRA
jgi:hypothetical protein